MDRVLFTVVAYLPVISGALGIGFLSAYLYNRVIRKKFIPNFLIIGCVGIGNFLLIIKDLSGQPAFFEPATIPFPACRI